MQPIFQPPVTPNNGNPNTVYNRKPGGEAQYRAALPDDPLGPVFGSIYESDSSPGGNDMGIYPVIREPDAVTKPVERSVAPVQGREVIGEAAPVAVPMPKPAVGPTFSEAVARPKPLVAGTVTDLSSGPVLSGPSTGGEYARYAEQQPRPVQDGRTTMGQWLPRFAIDTSVLGTQFGAGAPSPNMDYWRSRLQQITQPVQQPATPQEQVAPTKPVVTTAPTQPTSPVTAPDIRTPVEGPAIYGPDPQFQTGQFGLGAGLGLANMTTVASSIFPDDPARARRAAETIARTYPLMNEAQRAEVEELDNPRTTPERRRSLLQRLGDWIKAEWDKEMTQLREDPLAFWGDALLGPGAGTLVREGIDIFRPDVDPMINEGRAVVGRTRQTNTGDRSDERTGSR